MTTEGEGTNKVVSVVLKNAAAVDISVLGAQSPGEGIEDVTVTVTLEATNEQDFATGVIDVYARLRKYSLI